MSRFSAPGAIFEEREHQVPLDHAAPDGARITVFTREVAAPDGRDRPYLVFLQGGPGFEATRPTSPPTGWMKRALLDYRVLLLDQRGTGRSTPVGPTIPGDTPEAQAEYLTHFRADSIVRDCEVIRGELGVETWSVLGQSFGGFTSMTYLSNRSRGAARGVHHRRPVTDRPAGRRHLWRHVHTPDRAEPPLLRALPGRPRSCP